MKKKVTRDKNPGVTFFFYNTFAACLRFWLPTTCLQNLFWRLFLLSFVNFAKIGVVPVWVRVASCR